MDKIIWCFWMGGEFTKNRQESLQSLIENSGCTVNFVTEQNLKEYEVKEDPISPSFKYLSSVHKGAVLRSYFMYHFGGGYADIKRYNFSWIPYFNFLEQSDYSFIGYHEKARHDVAHQCPENVKDFWPNLVGNGYFIFKTKTEFAREWLDKTNKLLEYKFDDLKKHPGWYHPRAIPNGIEGVSEKEFNEFQHPYKTTKYPISWGEPMGGIFQSLQYEHKDSYKGILPYINTKNYL